eukprot:6247852-Amphidinium_carterae.1
MGEWDLKEPRVTETVKRSSGKRDQNSTWMPEDAASLCSDRPDWPTHAPATLKEQTLAYKIMTRSPVTDDVHSLAWQSLLYSAGD